MGKPIGAGTILYIAFLFMASCNSHDRAANPLDIPVDEGQRALAVDAANRLLDAFNNDSCHSIYEQAAAYFRTQPLEEWMSQCRELEENLGSFQSFGANSANGCGGGPSVVVVCVGGAARFTKGIREVEVAWLLDNGRTRLMWISLRQDKGFWAVMPPRRGPSLPIFDTPPRPLSGSDRTG